MIPFVLPIVGLVLVLVTSSTELLLRAKTEACIGVFGEIDETHLITASYII